LSIEVGKEVTNRLNLEERKGLSRFFPEFSRGPVEWEESLSRQRWVAPFPEVEPGDLLHSTFG
jgi:hypothetical protein